MARKALYYAIGLTVIQLILTLVASCRPFFSKPFFSVFFKVFDLVVYTLQGTTAFGSGSNDFCSAVDAFTKAANKGDHFCSKAEGSGSLQDVMQRWCAPGINEIMPDTCAGLSWAYILGLILIIFVVTNLVLQGVALWMTWNYVTDVPKRKYRKVSMNLNLIGAIPISVVLLLYGGLVIVRLESMTPRGLVGVVLTPSRGLGVSDGYILMWLGQIIQWAVVSLYQNGKSGAEDQYQDAKMHQELEAEMAAAHDLAMYGGGIPGAVGQLPPNSGPPGFQGIVGTVPSSGMGVPGAFGGAVPSSGLCAPGSFGHVPSFSPQQQPGSFPMAGMPMSQPAQLSAPPASWGGGFGGGGGGFGGGGGGGHWPSAPAPLPSASAPASLGFGGGAQPLMHSAQQPQTLRPAW